MMQKNGKKKLQTEIIRAARRKEKEASWIQVSERKNRSRYDKSS
jgi:hypothetical protein